MMWPLQYVRVNSQVRSDEEGKVIKGLKNTTGTYPEWSCFVDRDQNAALNIHGLLAHMEANHPCGLSRVPGWEKQQVVVERRILR
jgi:hypothetical protein